MSISKEKWLELLKIMESLGLFEKDLLEKFIIGSGKGGQKLHKTASCVYLKHLPSEIEVKCQKDRLREKNRFFARRILCEKFLEITQKEKTEKQRQIEKIRRQIRKRSKRQKEKILDEKKKQSRKKTLRKPPQQDDA